MLLNRRQQLPRIGENNNDIFHCVFRLAIKEPIVINCKVGVKRRGPQRDYRMRNQCVFETLTHNQV